MKKQFLCIVIALLISCTPPEKKRNETFQSTDYNFVNEQDLNWKALNAYVGKYSKETDFFKNALVKSQLKKILNDDYNAYLDFFESAGYGIIEKVDNIIYGDISLEHIGGYNSMILINTVERKMYLFWLYGTVREKDYKIYGERPYPEAIKKIIEDDMNTGFDHVARFEFHKDSLLINVINPTANYNQLR